MTRIRDAAYRTLASKGRTAVLAAIFVLGLGPGAVEARTNHQHDHPSAAEGEDLGQTAIYYGYGEGYACGDRDSLSGAEFKPRSGEVFQRGSSGYTAEMGAIGEYQSGFRQAYERGYEDGYHGRDRDLAMMIPPVPNPPGVEPAGFDSHAFGAAATNGYNAGYTYGAEARKGGGNFAYHDEEIYKTATQGYSANMGGQSQYQSVFRQVFSRGYSDGFNGRAPTANVGMIHGRDENPQPIPVRTEPIDVAQLAMANGYHEGFESGESNKRAGQSFAYRNDDAYFQGTIGYQPGWDKRIYRTAFRKGYLIGYNDGYRRRSRNSAYEDIYTRHQRSEP
jgi:hypothetical protein